MNKLDELIKKLCPDGVKSLKFEDCVDYEQPTRYIVHKEEYNATYDIPVLTAGQTFILGYTAEKDNIYLASPENPVIIFDDFTGAFKWVIFPFKVKSSAMKILTPCGNVMLRYVFHMMGHINFSSSEHKRLWISFYSQLSIPVPPLPVQEEIVRILDSFTKLEAELEAELEARRRQYEYYRDKLLSFNELDKTKNGGVKLMTLGEIATKIYRGSGITRNQITDNGIPCVRYGEIYTTYGIYFDSCFSHTDEEKIVNRKYFGHGDILFAITGENVEEIAKSTAYMGYDKCLAGGDIVVLKHNQNPKYLSYILSTEAVQKQKSKGKVKSKVVHSSVPAIQQIVIPVPPIEEQQRIVSILDRFDALISDLTGGLPAEIKARRQQYEYYRNKLLTFSPLQG